MNERLSLPVPAGEKPKVEAASMAALLRLLLISHPVDLLILPRSVSSLSPSYISSMNSVILKEEKQPQLNSCIAKTPSMCFIA